MHPANTQKPKAAISILSKCLVILILHWPPTTAIAQDIYTLANGDEIAPLEVFRDCDACPEMIALPMGSFVMGAPLEQSEFLFLLWNKPEPGEPVGMQQEGPEHTVVIDIPIAMGRNEVTREEWLACVDEGGCSHVPDPRILKFGGDYFIVDDPRHPVFDVSYNDIQDYLAWLNGKVGADVYRLPTETEWEYAARAGTQTRFAQGETLTTDQANIGMFHWEGDRYVSDPNNRKTPVLVDELDAANAWGLRHIAGNLMERTMSCWSDMHLGFSTSSAYLADARAHEACSRVVKGGSYGSDPEYARPANRGAADEDHQSRRAGFRIVREM